MAAKRAQRANSKNFTVTLVDGPARPDAKLGHLPTELENYARSSEETPIPVSRPKQEQRTDILKPTRSGFEVNIVQLARHLVLDAHCVVTGGASAANPGSAIREVLELYADRVGREQANYATATLVYTAVRAAHGDLAPEAVLRFARAARRENEWKGPNRRPVTARTITGVIERPAPSTKRGMVSKVLRIYTLLAWGSLALVQPTTSKRPSRKKGGAESLEQIIERHMKLQAIASGRATDK